MQFTSTRNSNLTVNFSQAVRDCIPEDGGVFTPSVDSIEDLRRWIYYIDENTKFSSIAGTLTSAFMQDEFSPIICETIAHSAFPFEPVVNQLDDNLFNLQLYHGYTGIHRDFGVSYLCSYLETTLALRGGNVTFLDYTNGSLGALLAKVLRGKNHIKAVLVYRKGTVRGLSDEDLYWNGGNIYPIEMEGTESELKGLITQIFEDYDFVKAHNLTVANTTNVCRFLAQVFFFPYAFSRIKNKIEGDIYYAMDADNYGTLMAGLCSWRFALPVSGFIMPSTAALGVDAKGNPVILDSMVNVKDRKNTNPVIPANLERLESFFGSYDKMIRSFVYPVNISEKQREKAAKELFIKYGVYADEQTARAYATVKARGEEFYDEDGTIVLVSYNHPSLSSEYCRHVIGEVPAMPFNIKESMHITRIDRNYVSSVEQIKEIVKAL